MSRFVSDQRLFYTFVLYGVTSARAALRETPFEFSRAAHNPNVEKSPYFRSIEKSQAMINKRFADFR